MTNKLPVVGKRYTFRMYKIKYPEVEVVAITKSYIIFVGVDPENGFTEKVHHCGKNVFFQYYKELPEDKAETKPETQSHISETSLIPSNSRELSPEVKEAMEELRKEKKYFELFKKINGEYDFQEQLKGYASVIFRKSLNLLNALDKQFANNKIQAEAVADNKIEAESNLLNFMYEKINNQSFSAELVFYLGQLIVEVCILKDRVKKLENK